MREAQILKLVLIGIFWVTCIQAAEVCDPTVPAQPGTLCESLRAHGVGSLMDGSTPKGVFLNSNGNFCVYSNKDSRKFVICGGSCESYVSADHTPGDYWGRPRSTSAGLFLGRMQAPPPPEDTDKSKLDNHLAELAHWKRVLQGFHVDTQTSMSEYATHTLSPALAETASTESSARAQEQMRTLGEIIDKFSVISGRDAAPAALALGPLKKWLEKLQTETRSANLRTRLAIGQKLLMMKTKQNWLEGTEDLSSLVAEIRTTIFDSNGILRLDSGPRVEIQEKLSQMVALDPLSRPGLLVRSAINSILVDLLDAGNEVQRETALGRIARVLSAQELEYKNSSPFVDLLNEAMLVPAPTLQRSTESTLVVLLAASRHLISIDSKTDALISTLLKLKNVNLLPVRIGNVRVGPEELGHLIRASGFGVQRY